MPAKYIKIPNQTIPKPDKVYKTKMKKEVN